MDLRTNRVRYRVNGDEMNPATATEALPWYRHRILWLVIAIPTLTVAGCLLTIYLAISTPHQLVSDPQTEAPAAAAER